MARVFFDRLGGLAAGVHAAQVNLPCGLPRATGRRTHDRWKAFGQLLQRSTIPKSSSLHCAHRSGMLAAVASSPSSSSGPAVASTGRLLLAETAPPKPDASSASGCRGWAGPGVWPWTPSQPCCSCGAGCSGGRSWSSARGGLASEEIESSASSGSAADPPPRCCSVLRSDSIEACSVSGTLAAASASSSSPCASSCASSNSRRHWSSSSCVAARSANAAACCSDARSSASCEAFTSASSVAARARAAIHSAPSARSSTTASRSPE
mmetsp:Transcript_43966/g.141764  ORF Transcript_43966/g.141764 Transcript_43966/m.141764 type:complete len:266 (-) Transcript_43966:423-1220(-)